jgi:hypothetical protein
VLKFYIYKKREGFGAGSVPLNNEYGSGSGWPKNMRIIRIPNIGTYGGGVGAGGPTQGQPTLHLWRHLQDRIHLYYILRLMFKLQRRDQYEFQKKKTLQNRQREHLLIETEQTANSE